MFKRFTRDKVQISSKLMISRVDFVQNKFNLYQGIIECWALFENYSNQCLMQIHGEMCPVKDDFQFVLRSLSTLMFINIPKSHSIECESMLFVTNRIPIFETFQILFPTASLILTAAKLFHQEYDKERGTKLNFHKEG